MAAYVVGTCTGLVLGIATDIGTTASFVVAGTGSALGLALGILAERASRGQGQ